MRYFAVVAVSAFLCAAPAAALDFGLTIDNTTGFDGDLAAEDPYELQQKDKVSAWLDAEIGDHLYLAAQGSYTFSLDRYWFLDVDHLYLKGQWTPGSAGSVLVGFQAGRFRASEFSGAVLGHTLDAVKINVGLPFMDIAASVGFTGLLFLESSSILIRDQDFVDAGGDGLLAPAKLIATASLRFPELFARQTVDIAYLTQYDFRFLFDDTVSGSLGTHYVGAGLRGPIAGPLYYSTYGYLEVGNTVDSTGGTIRSLGGLGGGSLRVYLRQALESVITAGGAYSTGDSDAAAYVDGSTDGLASTFLPLSASSFGMVFSPRLGNLALARAGYSFKPFVRTGVRALEKLQIKAEVLAFFRPTSGPISESGIDAASGSRWLGIEADGRINFRPLSDLGAALSYGIFIPGTAFDSESQDLRMKFSFELSLSI